MGFCPSRPAYRGWVRTGVEMRATIQMAFWQRSMAFLTLLPPPTQSIYHVVTVMMPRPLATFSSLHSTSLAPISLALPSTVLRSSFSHALLEKTCATFGVAMRLSGVMASRSSEFVELCSWGDWAITVAKGLEDNSRTVG